MKTLILCLSLILLIAACASPYQGQANALTQAYQNGQISANDYQARMTELQALDLQRRQAIAAYWQQGCQNLANNQYRRSDQQAAIMNSYQLRQPSTTYGTIYTPTGQMYQYNSTSY